MKEENLHISCSTQTEDYKNVTQIKKQESNFYDLHSTDYPWRCRECFFTFKNFKHWVTHQCSTHNIINHEHLTLFWLTPSEETSTRDPIPILPSDFTNPRLPTGIRTGGNRHRVSSPCDSTSGQSEASTEEADDLEIMKNISIHFLLGAALQFCNFCNKIFKDVYQAKSHVRMNHSGEKLLGSDHPASQKPICSTRPLCRPIPNLQKYFKCALCPRRFHILNEWQRHVEKKHPIYEEVIPAEIPAGKSKLGQKICKSKSVKDGKVRAEDHVIKKKVEGRTTGICKICKKKFQNFALTVQHVRTHLGEKPFECGICHRRFTIRSNMLRHRGFHDVNKKTECSVCRQFFSTASACGNHMKNTHGIVRED